MLVEILVSAFVLVGAFFTLVGSIGLARLPDFFTRLHGPSKATTLGIGGLLIASMLYFSTRGEGLSLHELLITVFLMVTAPVSAQMLAQAARKLRDRRR
jgi:multicomponent K+:H+ antiporter subunit G